MTQLPRRHFGKLALVGLLRPRPVRAGNSESAVDPGPTITATMFQDTLGIGAHWEHKDGVYGRRADQLVDALIRLGIHHVRGYDPAISARLAQHGVSAMLVAGPEVGSPSMIVRMVLEANASGSVIDAVEGPNEPDLFWPLHHNSYLGRGFPQGVVAYQRDLFKAIRAEPALDSILVIGPSLGRTYDPGSGHRNPFAAGSLHDAVDLGNFHPYPFGGNSFSLPFPYDTIKRYYWTGNFPSVNLDQYPYEFETYAPPFAPKSMAATETGYPTWRNGVSEQVQAKYIPRLMAEYCRLGVRRTYLYELLDDMPDPSGDNMGDHFGLIRNDLSVKPAYTALQSLLTLTAPSGPTVSDNDAPELRLSVRLPAGFDRPDYVHSLIVRRSNAEAVLLIWHEVASADTAASPPRSINVPVGSVDVSPAQPWQVGAWFDYDEGWRLAKQNLNAKEASGNSLTVPLRDRLVAVSLRRLS